MADTETITRSYAYGFGYLRGTITGILEADYYEISDRTRKRLEQALAEVENVGWQG